MRTEAATVGELGGMGVGAGGGSCRGSSWQSQSEEQSKTVTPGQTKVTWLRVVVGGSGRKRQHITLSYTPSLTPRKLSAVIMGTPTS